MLVVMRAHTKTKQARLDAMPAVRDLIKTRKVNFVESFFPNGVCLSLFTDIIIQLSREIMDLVI